MSKKKYLSQNEMLEELSELGIKRTPSWAEHARFLQKGPKHCKVAGRVVYPIEGIPEYLEQCEKGVAK
mgnify:CR=1 FL=1|jgi:hypothetical protein